ncbi:MAG: hypothetical protein AUK44_05720 [Porphyromonadaceae bacterium CG2_30_38_12]|nr:MAG: hypothetical protein AUK44_05720 [Porphyromonadaceae bacterium CG2_30_38_12]
MIKAIRYIENTYTSLSLVSKTLHHIKQQKSFAAKLLEPLLHEVTSLKSSDQFETTDSERMMQFAVYIPSFLGEAFCVLRGKAMSEAERQALTYLASMTGLFDDMFDAKNETDAHIQSLLQHPALQHGMAQQEVALVKLYVLFFEKIPDAQPAQALMQTVFEAQVASRLQVEQPLSDKDLWQITSNKGGRTMQLFRCAFAGQATTTENHLFFLLGAAGQLENDIFDMQKDTLANVQTLATTTKDLKQLRARYLEACNEVVAGIEQTDFNPKNKKKFRQVCAMITARGLVAIHSYEQNKSICDMEKWQNKLLTLHYAALL